MTRPYTILALAVGVLGLILWLVWPPPAPLLPTAGSAVVLFGDSLAHGTGASTGNDIASQLSQALERDVINLGIPGDTTADGLARIDDVLATDPRVVIILLGGNDALQQVPIEQTFTNLSTIIERLQAAGAAIVLVGEPGGVFSKRFDHEYTRLAETYRTFYVSNILSGLIGRPEYMSDAIHPNDIGYKKATGRILPVVQAALANS
jgi:acyl-CoA thioesterase-1